MAEGVAVAGGPVLSRGVHDDPASRPEPCEEAPRGWTWNRPGRSWVPKVKGKILWEGGSDPAAGTASTSARADISPEPGTPQEQRDPAPGWVREDDRPPAGKLKFEDVPQQVKDDLAGFAGLIGTPVLALLQQADPHCGSALAQNFEPIVDATLPLMCRSEKLVQYFSGDKSDWLLWGKLALALRPVGQAILEHHVFGTVHIVKDEKTGAVTVVRGRPGERDPLQPPAADPAAYAV